MAIDFTSSSLNTFASERLYFEEKLNLSFCLKNASKMTHESITTVQVKQR